MAYALPDYYGTAETNTEDPADPYNANQQNERNPMMAPLNDQYPSHINEYEEREDDNPCCLYILTCLSLLCCIPGCIGMCIYSGKTLKTKRKTAFRILMAATAIGVCVWIGVIVFVAVKYIPWSDIKINPDYECHKECEPNPLCHWQERHCTTSHSGSSRHNRHSGSHTACHTSDQFGEDTVLKDRKTKQCICHTKVYGHTTFCNASYVPPN